MLTIILVCPADRLPTRYRQVANRSPTVGRLLADSRPTLWPQTYHKLLADSWPSVVQLLADSRPSVGQQLANSRPTVGQLSADRRPTVGRQTANSWPSVGQLSADSKFWELFFTITAIKRPTLFVYMHPTAFCSVRQLSLIVRSVLKYFLPFAVRIQALQLLFSFV